MAVAAGALKVSSDSQDPQGLATAVLSVLVEESRALSNSAPETRSLFVDLGSFMTHMTELGDTADVRGLNRIGDIPFEDVSRDTVVTCSQEGPTRGCRVAEDGMLMSMRSLRHQADTAVAVAQYEMTERRPTGNTGLHIGELEIELSWVDSRWVVTDVQVVMIT